MADASPAIARFPLAVKQLLEQALALRDRYLTQKISLHGPVDGHGSSGSEARPDAGANPTRCGE
jgi:hypothetical protein